MGALVASRAGAETLSWRQCVEEAAKGNAGLQAAEERLRSAERQAQAARSGYYPQVTGTLGYSYGENSFSGGIGGSGDPQSSFNAEIEARQSLFAGFQNEAKVTQAEAAVEVARTALETARAETSFALKGAFERLSYAQENRKLTQEIIRRREENLRLVALRFESGRENKGSVRLFEAYLDQAKYEDLQATHAVLTARSELARVLGREDDEIEATGAVPVDVPEEKPVFEEIAKKTPAYREAVARREAALAAIGLAKSPFYPSLDLTGSAAREGEEFEDGRWSVGVDLTLPLFSGFRNYHGTESARSELLAASADAQAAIRQVRVSLRETHAAYVESLQKLKADEGFLEAATLRAEISRSKYNNGLLSFEDWDLIENDLIDRQKRYLQSRRDRVTSQAAWERAQGKAVLP